MICVYVYVLCAHNTYGGHTYTHVLPPLTGLFNDSSVCFPLLLILLLVVDFKKRRLKKVANPLVCAAALSAYYVTM